MRGRDKRDSHASVISYIKNKFISRKRSFLNVAETEDGKALLAEIYQFCETKDPIVPNDPLSTGRNIGKELVAKHIKKILNQDDRTVEHMIANYESQLKK